MKKLHSHLPVLFRSYSKEIKFLLLFIVFLLVGHIIVQLSFLKIGTFLINVMHTKVSAFIIGILSQDGSVVARNSSIVSKHLSMEIAKGCDGTEGILLIAAAMLAYPAGMIKRAYGLIAGVCVIYVFNLIRIIGLWFVLGHAPALFDFVHVYVGQTFIILFGFLYFLWWVTRGEPSP